MFQTDFDPFNNWITYQFLNLNELKLNVWFLSRTGHNFRCSAATGAGAAVAESTEPEHFPLLPDLTNTSFPANIYNWARKKKE